LSIFQAFSADSHVNVDVDDRSGAARPDREGVLGQGRAGDVVIFA